jgi:hypothetical protein
MRGHLMFLWDIYLRIEATNSVNIVFSNPVLNDLKVIPPENGGIIFPNDNLPFR